jgi:hypothetical protein
MRGKVTGTREEAVPACKKEIDTGLAGISN